eukprot:9243417-Pyramimonas_sp.AAC.1
MAPPGASQLTERIPLLAKCLLASVRRDTRVPRFWMERGSPASDPGHLRVVPVRVVERACLAAGWAI